MEFANKVVAAATKVANNNIVIDVCLVSAFGFLGVRSLNQQKYIEDLKAEKESLTKTNKDMKKVMWDWKQQLFAEATSSVSPLVPLANLKAIYGETPSPPTGGVANEGAESRGSKFVV